MDLSCSLDVLVRNDPPLRTSDRSDPLASVLRATQERIDAAFRDGDKIVARRRSN